MAENHDLQRLEDQLYQYYPELKRDSEDLKSERRKRLCSQLRYNSPFVQLPAFDAVSSLVNIKNLLDKCKESVVEPVNNCLEMAVASPSTSLFESSGDEFLMPQRPRRIPRKRKSGSSHFLNSEIVESRNEQQDSPLSVSILIPQVVQCSDKMEFSIDLGGIDASQRLFGSRVDGLLRNRSLSSSNTLEDLDVKERPCTSNKMKNLQLTASTSSSIQTTDNSEKQDDEMLSRLISEVLVENNDTETLQATNVLDNINNNESSNYDAVIPTQIVTLKAPKKKKAPRKSKKDTTEKGPPKKRGRKPKNKSNKQDGSLENVGLPKSDLAKYVELFSNTCNMAGSATPAASSTMSQQLVTSTTHYLDSNEQPPITYYLEGDWENGGSCQLVQTESVPIDGAQEEFNLAELVNYIDNVGDDGNVIARVLDGTHTLPILVQDSNTQSNSIVPPPAHVSDVLLDLSKKSTITFTPTASEINHNSNEVANHEILPLDLSLKTSNYNHTPIAFNENLRTPMRLEAASEEVFVNNDYGSFEAALDMPLIDIEDNINAFMQLTNSEVITSENTAATRTTLTKVCDGNVNENTNIRLPLCDFELSEILAENNVCNSDCNTGTQSVKILYNENNGSNSNITNDNVNTPESIINIPINTDEATTDVRINNVNIAPGTDNVTTTDVIGKFSTTIPILAKENEQCSVFCSSEEKGETNFVINAAVKADITESKDKEEMNSEIHNATAEKETNSEDATCIMVEKSNSELAFTQKIADNESCNNTEQNESTIKDDVSIKKPPNLMDIEGSVDHNDELHGNLSDKSSMDLLFVDTDSLPSNRLKYSYDEPITDISDQFLIKTEIVENSDAAEEPDGTLDNDDVVCDLSTKNDHSTSIDLEEECQGHNVSVHLPMPQLTLMETSSEEFSYDYDIGFESAEEKDLLTVATEQQALDETQCKVLGDQNGSRRYSETAGNCTQSKISTELPVTEIKDCNVTDQRLDNRSDQESKKSTSFEKENITEDEAKENSTFEDSAVFCSQKYVDASKEMETGTPGLEENKNLAQNHNLDVIEDSKFNLHVQPEIYTQKLTRHSSIEENEKVVIKTESPLTGLSVLEMESKLDDGCLDFEDELEDDALSLATSYFNSSDDERLPEHHNNSTQTSSDNITANNCGLDVVTADNALNTENNVSLRSSSNISKMPTVRETSAVSGDIFRKFKIPKLSMTSATVKHSNTTGSVAAAAPLPMVILPSNAFHKQSIKTEPDTNKPAGFEKITRTVQNVCAVTPLTLQHSTYASTSAAAAAASTTSSSLEVVAPLIRDILQLTPPIVGPDLKDFKTIKTGGNMPTSLNSPQLKCTRGETAGNGGDGRNFGPPTIVVAKTFGVTCLSFLVGRCFTLTSCQFSHAFRDATTVKSILSTLSDVDLNVAYKFAYSHEIVFRQYMREFCKVYTERNNRLKLLNMVRDCERYRGGGELLITIFHSLLECGLNKVNACRQILSYSRDRSRTTIDALVDIILESDWTMFCDYIEKFSDVSTYHFRLNVLHQMAPTILRANDQRMTSVFFKCLVNLDPKDVGLVQSSPILMQLLELIKNGQTCR